MASKVREEKSPLGMASSVQSAKKNYLLPLLGPNAKYLERRRIVLKFFGEFYNSWCPVR